MGRWECVLVEWGYSVESIRIGGWGQWNCVLERQGRVSRIGGQWDDVLGVWCIECNGCSQVGRDGAMGWCETMFWREVLWGEKGGLSKEHQHCCFSAS